MKYRFELQKGGEKHFCPACKCRRFVRYVDTWTGAYIADEVGRCDREDSCGYHLTPREYYAQSGTKPGIGVRAEIKRQPRHDSSFTPHEIMQASLTGYHRNNFYCWLCSVFGDQQAMLLIDVYKIGTSKYWHGSCVFWQIDRDNMVRGGKVMLYNAETGRRVKEPVNHIHWVHKIMEIETYNLQQCWFGEHLISVDLKYSPKIGQLVKLVKTLKPSRHYEADTQKVQP